jgi:hypothetical protein
MSWFKIENLNFKTKFSEKFSIKKNKKQIIYQVYNKNNAAKAA